MAELISLGTARYTAVPAAVPQNYWGLMAAWDIDGNGYDDFIVTRAYYPDEPYPATARAGFVLFGSATGYQLADEQRFEMPALLNVHTREIAFADFNEDGTADIFVADHGYDASPFPGQQNLLFLSDGSGGWDAGTLPALSDFTHSVAIGDVNHDGHLDILAGNYGSTASYFLLGDGAGGFTRSTALLPAEATQVGASACLLADLDLDGLDDLVLGGHQIFANRQLFWNDEGSFAEATGAGLPQPSFGQDWSIMDIQATDANFDGLPDLILAYQANVWAGGWLLQVLINQGDRSFEDQTALYIPDAQVRSGGQPGAGGEPAWIVFLTPRDLNGDGRMDFAIASSAWGRPLPDAYPLALIHQEDGTFQAVTAGSLAAAGMPRYILDTSPHLIEGPQGPAFVQVFPSGSAGMLGVNSIAVSFAAPATQWCAGTQGADVLVGSAGPDDFGGFAGNDTIQGGAGIDQARYNAARADVTLTKGVNGWTVASAADGSDVLSGIERLRLADVSLALDLDGHAGSVAKILRALFGPEYLSHTTYVGIGLDMLDDGFGYPALVDLVVQSGLLAQLAGSSSNTAFVNFVYENVVGAAPSTAERDYYVGLLADGTFTQSTLAFLACETPQNSASIDLVGLSATGLAYQPVV